MYYNFKIGIIFKTFFFCIIMWDYAYLNLILTSVGHV